MGKRRDNIKRGGKKTKEKIEGECYVVIVSRMKFSTLERRKREKLEWKCKGKISKSYRTQQAQNIEKHAKTSKQDDKSNKESQVAGKSLWRNCLQVEQSFENKIF